ncbi:eCIS core domain-containing protein [Kitasatospora sp. SC0581]|uniref:eCIS core domain-containing protein n=1 Tax=Kitasatospora sp. SC0581 TaxID=3394360 RepID=UPI003A897F5C
MTQLNAPARDSAQDAKQGGQARRKTRAPKARTPEPKEIVSGAGQPLDPGVRRELEARLGHDLSRVRVHTDRDSAALTELIGADAVAVGPDLFFGEGKYRPAAEDGRRLLTHELLHTIQAPNPLGALRAGRDLGAVSLPQDAVEREAEQGASGDRPTTATPSATPGWLRYATVDADRFRTERLDPATLVDRLASGILRSLRGDPTDSSGRVRLQLARFAPELQSSVLDRLAVLLPSSDYTRVLELVEAAEHRPADVDAAQTPEPVTDAADRTTDDRDRTDQEDREERDRKQQLDDEERQSDDPKARSKHRKHRKGHGGKDEKDGDEERPEQQDGQQAPPAEGEAAQTEPAAQPAAQPEAGQAQLPTEAQPSAVEEAPAAGPEQAPVPAEEGAAQPVAATVPGSPEAEQQGIGTRPSAGTKPQEPAAGLLPQTAPVKPERLDAIARAEDSPLARHGLLEGDHRQGEAPDEERPLGMEPGADSEVHDAPAAGEDRPSSAVPGPELKPGDFLPSADLDVSAVPTADQLTLSADGTPPAQAEAPEFPEPPATKAEQVQAERDSRPEDDAETAPAPPEQAEPGAAPQAAPEPTPATEAEDRSARDLQPEQPVEQEIGPEPTANPAAAPAPAPAEPTQPEAPQPETPAEAAREAEPAPEAAPEAAASPEPSGPDRTAPVAPGPVGGSGPVGGDGAVLDSAPGAAPDTALDAAPGPAAEQADAPGGLTAQAAPDASLEAGGGACAGPQQPTTEAEQDGTGGAGGGCAGGGGAAAGGAQGGQEQQKPAAPDVSGQDPQSALATAASLPPDQLATTLDGVDGSVDRTVGEQHARLQAAPPTTQRPSGAPQTQSGAPEAAPPAEAVTERLERVGPEGADGGQRTADQKKVEGRNPGDRVAPPNVADDAGNQVSAQEVQQAQVAVDGVPSTDPALNTTVGAAPKVELTGESDPARTDRQAAKLKESSGRILGVGREDTAKPMGEDRIYPDVPKETLTASVPGGGGKRGGARAGGAVDTKPGIGIVTQQERGPQIQAAVGEGQGRLGSEQAQQKQGEADARRQNQAEVDQAVADNAQAQAGERGDAAERVKAEREQWRTEQDGKITTADQDAGAEHTDKTGQIDKKRAGADKDVQDRQQQDNQKIQDKRKEAEEKAQKEKDRKKEESEGWWGWVKSKVKAAFDALVEAVTKVFDFFRGLINDIIDGFRKFANWAIDQARKFAVELIDKLADALIKICDVLLAAFPELRDKFRKKIEEWRDKAIAKVNEWADRLKNAVNKLLDALAAGLNALLDALEAGLKAAIEAVRKAVMDAIDFVQKAIAVFGEFAALIGDIAPDPGGWLKKLGTAAVDGIQHYLWGAIKSAVRTWFNEKVESVVGLTSTIVNVLVKGCISMAQIGRMAWQAIVAALPGMIVSIVVEKLVSMIVPAAGAIMTIIQGLMAAWNTISKIIAAIGKFVAFLKAVKSGSAACLFADAVAAGVVALLDFISNFLLSKLKGAGKAVGTKLKGIAQRILKGLARAGRGARKAAGRAVNKARASLRRATQSLRRRPGPGRPARPARPARTGPARHTVQHAERPAQHRPTATRPKPATPRRPTSPVGRALNSSRQTVKAALNRVRTAARTLGRKVLNSKLGRALTNGAHRIRDAYRKQRDRLRTWHQKRQQQRAQRRKRENSPEAKQQRLAAILARLRPRLHRLLGRGLPDKVLSAVLRALRVWYRLTGLDKVGSSAFHVLAKLNPQETAVDGIDVDIADRVVLMINKIGEEYRARALQANGGRAQPEPASAARDTSELGRLVSKGNVKKRQTVERFEVDVAQTPYQASGMVQSIPARDSMNIPSYVEYRDNDRILASVRRDQGPSYSGKVQREDQLVHWTWREDDTLKSAALKHNEWTAKLESEWTPAERRALATSALSVISGGKPEGRHQQNAAELAQWHFQVEGGRDPATFALTAMGLDMASRGRGRLKLGDEEVDYSDLLQFARDFPMRELKAKKIRKNLHKHMETVQKHWDNPVGARGNPLKRPLNNTDSKAGQEKSDMRRRQLRIFRAWLASVDDLKAWAKELEGLAAESPQVVEARLAQLEKLIRARLEKLWEKHSGSTT